MAASILFHLATGLLPGHGGENIRSGFGNNRVMQRDFTNFASDLVGPAIATAVQQNNAPRSNIALYGGGSGVDLDKLFANGFHVAHPSRRELEERDVEEFVARSLGPYHYFGSGTIPDLNKLFAAKHGTSPSRRELEERDVFEKLLARAGRGGRQRRPARSLYELD